MPLLLQGRRLTNRCGWAKSMRWWSPWSDHPIRRLDPQPPPSVVRGHAYSAMEVSERRYLAISHLHGSVGGVPTFVVSVPQIALCWSSGFRTRVSEFIGEGVSSVWSQRWTWRSRSAQTGRRSTPGPHPMAGRCRNRCSLWCRTLPAKRPTLNGSI